MALPSSHNDIVGEKNAALAEVNHSTGGMKGQTQGQSTVDEVAANKANIPGQSGKSLAKELKAVTSTQVIVIVGLSLLAFYLAVKYKWIRL